jgi:hypothetical protein
MLQSAQGQNFKNPGDYFNFIKKENGKIGKSIWKYTRALAHSNSPYKIEKDRLRLIKSVEQAITKIKRAKPYQGEEAYKKEVLEYLELYLRLLGNDYAEIVRLKDVADQSYDTMEGYILAQKITDQRILEAQEAYATAQKKYAERNYIQLIDKESELGEKIKTSNTVLDYKNEIYLIFFKSNIQERFLLNGVATADITTIQEHTATLQKTAEEGIQQLANFPAYQQDSSLIEATKIALEFFLEETQNEIPKMVAFFSLNEKFSTIRESIQKKGIKNRTSEEIKQYNTMVEDVNKAAADFNKRNQELNQKRTEIIQQWNEASAKFLSRHIPKN